MATFKKQKSGKWEAQVMRGGVRKSKSFATKMAAKDWANSFEAKILAGNITPDAERPTETVADLFDRYARTVSPTKRGKRWEQIRLHRLSAMPIGTIRVDEIARKDVIKWRDQRLQEVSASSVNREMNLLSHVFNTAIREWDFKIGNPCATVGRPKMPLARDRLVKPGELEAIRAAAKFNGQTITGVQHRVVLAFEFAIETAMRAGEVAGVIWDDIDLDARTAHLPAEICKTGIPRNVPLSPRALEILQMLKDWKPDAIKPFELDASQISSNWRILTKRAKVEDLHFHDSRHEATTRLSKKMPVQALARVTGHRNLNQLLTYYNETAAELAKLLD